MKPLYYLCFYLFVVLFCSFAKSAPESVAFGVDLAK